MFYTQSYNDGLATLESLDISGGSERYVYGDGDLVVNADGFDFMCNRWNSSIVVDCFNVRNKSPAANHLKMIWENVTIKYLINRITDDDWKKKKIDLIKNFLFFLNITIK